jgi:hypothetical protein
MALKKSKTAVGLIPVASLVAAVGATLVFEYVTEAAALAVGDIIQMGPLEAGVKPLSSSLYTDKLDTNAAPTIVLSVGILNAAMTDIDAAATAAWITASNVAQAGGVAHTTTANPYLSGVLGTNRQIGVKVITAAATWAGAGKKMAVTMLASAP